MVHTMEKKTKEEKPVPKRCICGAEAITCKTKHGKMVTCPNPAKCGGNLRTRWLKSEDLAIKEWNALVNSFAYGSGK